MLPASPKGEATMRRIGGALLVTASLVGTLFTSPAIGQDSKVYKGHLEDGNPISALLVEGRAGTLRLRETQFRVVFACEDGSSQAWGILFAFFPGDALIDRILTLDIVDPDLAVHIHGRFGAHRASGDLRATIPALTVDEQAQLCTTGDLTWTMRRRSAARTPAVPAGADGRIHVRFGPPGTDPVVRVRPA
jgi:hypothetical protein